MHLDGGVLEVDSMLARGVEVVVSQSIRFPIARAEGRVGLEDLDSCGDVPDQDGSGQDADGEDEVTGSGTRDG